MELKKDKKYITIYSNENNKKNVVKIDIFNYFINNLILLLIFFFEF